MGRNKVKLEQASKVLMRMPTLRSFSLILRGTLL